MQPPSSKMRRTRYAPGRRRWRRPQLDTTGSRATPAGSRTRHRRSSRSTRQATMPPGRWSTPQTSSVISPPRKSLTLTRGRLNSRRPSLRTSQRRPAPSPRARPAHRMRQWRPLRPAANRSPLTKKRAMNWRTLRAHSPVRSKSWRRSGRLSRSLLIGRRSWRRSQQMTASSQGRRGR